MTKKFRTYRIVSSDRYFNTWVLLQQTYIAYSKLWRRRLQEQGMRPGQISVLFVLINKRGSSTAGEIAEWLGREPHTITGFINQMEREGLVRRKKAHQDKRFTSISITSKGREAYKKLSGDNPIIGIVSRLKDEDLDCLARCLEYIRLESLKLMYDETETVAVTARFE